MAKGSRGGQRAGGTLSGGASLQQQQTPQQQQQVQVDDTQQSSDFGLDYIKFMALSDDEKADVIADAVLMDVPAHLAQNDFQRFIYNTGLNDKPDVVSDATLDSMKGEDLFRTVNGVYDKNNDINYNADQIVKQVQAGRVTRTDGSASVLGKGLYFAGKTSSTSAYYESTQYYGKTRGNIKQTAVMRAKLNSNAKIIDHLAVGGGVQSEINRGTRLGKVLKDCDSASRKSIYAMCKGYNVIKDGNYFNVLNRNAMTMSSDIKEWSKSGKWK